VLSGGERGPSKYLVHAIAIRKSICLLLFSKKENHSATRYAITQAGKLKDNQMNFSPGPNKLCI
jgi:hypothetical protein